MPSRYPPLPTGYRDWKDWAAAFLAYSSGGADIKKPTEPKAILLAHQLGSVGNIGGERAITSGILMYSAALSAVMVSNGTEWKALATADALTGYLPLTGGTMTGDIHTDQNLKVSAGSRKGVKFFSDLSVKRAAIVSDDDSPLQLIPADTAGTNLDDDALLFDRALQAWCIGLSGAVTESQRVLTQLSGDTRYLQTTGGTLTGPLTINTGNLNVMYLYGRTSDNLAQIQFLTSTGAPVCKVRWSASTITLRNAVDLETYRFDQTSVAPLSAISVLTRQGGDSRYLPLTGGTITGDFTLKAGSGATSPDLVLRDSANVELGRLWADGGVVKIRAGTNLSYPASIEYTTATNLPASTSIVTRARGDARYAALSSRKFKERLSSRKTPVTPKRPSESVSLIDQLETHTWVWGGELPAGSERIGEAGFGLVAEEVAELLPAAVTHQWEHDEEGNDTGTKSILGLDPLALIGVLVDEIQALRSRVDTLESINPKKKRT